MSLRDRQLRTRQQSQSTQHQTEQEQDHGAATWGNEYTRPIQAIVDGEPVYILQPANVVGMSPVFLCVDTDGTVAFVPVSDVKITDPLIAPNAARQGSRQLVGSR